MSPPRRAATRMIAKSPAMPMCFHATLFEGQKHIPKRQRRENNPVPRRTFEDGLFSEVPRSKVSSANFACTELSKVAGSTYSRTVGVPDHRIRDTAHKRPP